MMFKQFIGKLFGWSATPVRRSGPQRSPALCVERLEARDNPSTFGTATLMDFLPTGYQYGPNSGSDPVFQQGNAAWMAATMSSGSGTVVTDSNTVGSGILSDILTMASNPWTTTTGFVSGIGSTFMDGSAADSLTGAAVQMADTMFGWTEISIFQAENFGPKFGNQEAFNNGQTVGVIWGTANNVVLLANSVYNLPANIQILANATGSLVFTTAEGLQIVAGGIATIEAAVPVVVNGAIAIDATIAIATGPLGGVPGNVIAMTVTNSGGGAGNFRPINPDGLGINAETLKPDFAGGLAGQFNLVVDGNGQIVLVPVRAGTHPNVPTGLTLEQAVQMYPL